MRNLTASLLIVGTIFLRCAGCPAQEQTPPEYLTQDLSLSVGSGARAFGMGGAFIAVADDGTASSWNPAGLAVLIKPEASIVMSPYSRTDFDLPSAMYRTHAGMTYLGESATTLTGGSLDFASIAYPLTLGRFRVVPQVSYQRAILLGLERTQTPALLRSRAVDGSEYNETSSLTSDGSGGIDIAAFGLGIDVHPRFQLGVSVNRWYHGATTELTSQINSVSCDAGSSCVEQSASDTVHIHETFGGWNATFGMLARPVPRLRIGAVYKTTFDMAHRFSAVGNIFEYRETGTIRWPKTIGFGVALVPNDQLTASADYTWINWSAARYESMSRYDPFQPYQSNPAVIWPTRYNPSLPDDIVIDNVRQLDATQKRFGVEYAFFRKWIIPVRGGFFQEKHFLPDQNGNRIRLYGITAGAGLVFPHLALDVALVYEEGRPKGCSFDQEGISCRADGNVRFSFDKLYLSGIYRF